MKHFILLLFTLLPLSANAEKPNLWVLTDMSDPNDRRAGGHPQNDPDDIVSLASLLLQANRFHIERIVYASNQREGLKDPTAFVNEVFVAAYQHDLPYLKQKYSGYPDSISYALSSINQNGSSTPFDRDKDYRDLSELSTVQDLVSYASEHPVYVLIWGPATEAAMAVQHCLTTGNDAALRNMTFVAHWTKSLIAQGTPEKPFHVANCRDDEAACHYLHEIALEHPDVKYIELGSSGQTGIVNGSANYPEMDEFANSRLGQIFRYAKFYHGKPDQSDGATFWLVTEAFGPTLSDVAHDGSLEMENEKRIRDLFLEKTYDLLDDSLAKSNTAAQAGNPFPNSFIAQNFTYIYQYLNGRYYIYSPLPANYEVRAPSRKLVLSGKVDGNLQLDFSQLPLGPYQVTVKSTDFTKVAELTKTK
ncbi:DUF1593 domain-containing protein [Pelagicoccus enzymogenes]|uniref:nucleoside hydrolase-like domain-containing protein n=1 Tax=Pelagicoccus enzymogenes TaxID=2773457 RepID=UPI00280F50DF|nr:nucleoside hydrolase-like domain-containing protein [Pelagicoccus enzymogenes]MDQ8197999.1 DUF1593 domain-containing protein [Pelagicoccus enzymogenes]